MERFCDHPSLLSSMNTQDNLFILPILSSSEIYWFSYSSVPAVFLDIAASVSKLVWSHVVVLQLLNANATLGLNLSSWKMYLYISGSASRTMSGQNIVNGLVLLFVIFYSTRALKALWTTCLVNPFTSRHTSTKNNQKTWITSTQFLFTFCEFHLYLFFSVSPARIKK